VLRDERALAALAEASRDELSALLVLVRRAEDHDYPGWLAWVQAHFIERPFSLPVLKSALELNAFLPNRIFPEVIPYLVLGYLCPALWASAEFRPDQLASLPAAEAFARALPDADMPRPAAFARWYRDRIDARAGKADVSLLLADLSLPAPFGARPRFRTFDAL